MLSPSATSNFYQFIIKLNFASALSKTLLGRVLKFSSENNINLAKYIFVNTYNRKIRPRVCHPTQVGVNGLVDTARYLLSDYNMHNNQLLQSILSAFYFLRKLSL